VEKIDFLRMFYAFLFPRGEVSTKPLKQESQGGVRGLLLSQEKIDGDSYAGRVIETVTDGRHLKIDGSQ
jgi:hypothetical protein